MQTIQRFFKNIYLSATKPQSYPPRLAQSFSSALGYLYWLLVCTTLISAVGFAALLWAARPQIGEFVRNAEQELAGMYPDELVLTLSGGELSTNVETPYTIDPWFWSSEKLRKEFESGEKDMPAHFVVIDLDASVESYDSQDTLILLTRTSAVARDNDGIRLMPYSELETDEPLVLDKATYMELVTAVQPFVEMIPSFVDGLMLFLIVLWPFVGGFFHWLGLLAYLLVFTLAVLLMSNIMKRRLTYGQLYHLSLYGITLSVLYGLVSSWIPQLSALPFIFTLIFLVWMWSVLKTFPIGPKAPAKKTVTIKAGGSVWEEHVG